MRLFSAVNLKPKRLNFFWKGSAFLCLFLLLLLLETTQLFTTVDPKTTLFLQSLIPRYLDMPLSLFSLLGAFELTSIVVLLLVYWLYWQKRIVYLPLGILFSAILVLELVGKFLVYHPGPPKDFFRYSIPFHFPSGYVQTNYSFPSGHVSRTTFLLVVGIFFSNVFIKESVKKKLALIALLLLGLMMIISRIYLGEHWLSDVLGGLFLGGAMGMFALVYY